MSEKSIIQQLKDNRYPFGMWPKTECYGKEVGEAMQAKAREIGRKRFEWYADGWKSLTDSFFVSSCTYRLRDTYKETSESKWPDKVFASTTDSEKDSMNNVVGVTAHCVCGHVFCDDVVHGKSQSKATKETPEIVEVVEEWAIFTKDKTLRFARHLADRDEQGTEIDLAIRNPDFIGFKFEDGTWYEDAIMPVNRDGSVASGHITIEDVVSGRIAVLHATHVLFRRSK